MKAPLLKIDNIDVALRSHAPMRYAVREVSLQLNVKQSVGIVGESGSGKTQLVSSLFGLNRSDPGLVHGEVYWKGHLIMDASAVDCKNNGTGDMHYVKKYGVFKKQLRRLRNEILGKEVAFLFQEPKSSLVPYQTVKEHFHESCRIYYGSFEKKHQAMVTDLLNMLGFDDSEGVMFRYPGQLSGGEAQRIALALALIGKPELLVADEPTSALDPLSQKQMITLIKKVVKEQNMSLIFITHDIHLLRLLTSRIIVMNEGRLVEYIDTERLSDSDLRKHPYTKHLTRAADVLWGKASNNGEYRLNHHGYTASGCPFANRCPEVSLHGEEFEKRCKEKMPPLYVMNESQKTACWLEEKK